MYALQLVTSNVQLGRSRLSFLLSTSITPALQISPKHDAEFPAVTYMYDRAFELRGLEFLLPMNVSHSPPQKAIIPYEGVLERSSAHSRMHTHALQKRIL